MKTKDRKLILFFAFLILAINFVSAASPVLFFSDLVSGPNTGGQNNKGVFVTIFGNNFGATRGSSYVTVGGGVVDNYPVWGEKNAANPNLDMITFQLGANAQIGDIVVHTSEGDSNGLPFTVRAGRIFFVDDTSPNNPGSGTYEDPWRSPTSFYNIIQPGDTCYFKEGTYGGVEYGKTGWGSVICLAANKGGSSNNEVSWVGYPKETATFFGGSLGQIFRWSSSTGSDYINICSLTMSATGPGIASALGHNKRFIGNTITSVPGAYGAILCNGDNMKILGNEIKNGGPGRNLEHSIYIQDESRNFEVGWNYMHDNNWGHEISIHSDKGYETPLQFTGTIHDNIITCTDSSDARGINVGETSGANAGLKTTDIDIYNNIIYKAGGDFSGICIYSGKIDVFNNILYDISATMILISGTDWEKSGEIRNNILYSTGGNNYISGASLSDFVISDNCYYGNGNGPSEDIAPVNADPLFVNPSSNNFHLQQTSPAIDAGIDVSSIVLKDFDGNLRPQGSGFDIGAYEYLSSEPIQYHPADTNQNNKIEMKELITFIARWKNAEVTVNDILTALDRWFRGS